MSSLRSLRSLAARAPRAKRALRLLLSLLVASALLVISTPARAYPWMIRHEYTGCAMCHLDPSGGFVLTEYGRAQSDLLLRTRYGAKAAEAEEPSPTSGFLWGAVTPPDWLLLGGTGRALGLVVKTPGQPATARVIEMQADLRAALKINVLRAGGSLGFQQSGGREAQLTHFQNGNLVSREHWVGASLLDDALLIRAGRINLPFGIRSIEHTLWVRTSTRTDINVGQQHGVAAAYNGGSIRAEVMAILGNFQIGPDAYRERGYSGYFEWALAPRYALGLSSLVTTALLDVTTRTSLIRQSHGLFFRGSPWRPLVLMAEVDSLIKSPAAQGTTVGVAGMLQADVEILQGVHTMGTFELLDEGGKGAKPSVGGWLTTAWFFAPHADIRIDGIVQNVATPTSSALVVTGLTQLHVFL